MVNSAQLKSQIASAASVLHPHLVSFCISENDNGIDGTNLTIFFRNASGEIQPGCGCDDELVTKVVEDLKKRQQGRGDQGQVQRQEVMMEEIEAINTKLDAIMDHLKMERS